MRKTLEKKLVLPKETLRELRVPQLTDVAGAGPVTRIWCSCGNILSTCPAP